MANGASCMSTIRSRHWTELPNFPTHCGNNLSFLGTERSSFRSRIVELRDGSCRAFS